jgi:type VI secretion system protein ImpL
MLPKKITQIILYGVGLGSLAAVVYFAGPFIAIGNWHPLENTIVRSIVILLLVAGAAGVGGFSFFRRRKAAKQIADGISSAEQTVNDESVLKERMTDALTTLKAASGNKSGYLYDLPWYVIIGPPGAGKTTALVNSGLKFPLSRGAGPRSGRGRRRHTLLRLVVHGRGRSNRYGGTLYDAGLRRQKRQGKLVLVP